MTVQLHEEFEVTVTAIQPWGLDVELPDGAKGLVDITKDPLWRAGCRTSMVGDSVRAVIIDDERIPIRLSALDVDLQIVRALRRSARDGRGRQSGR